MAVLKMRGSCIPAALPGKSPPFGGGLGTAIAVHGPPRSCGSDGGRRACPVVAVLVPAGDAQATSREPTGRLRSPTQPDNHSKLTEIHAPEACRWRRADLAGFCPIRTGLGRARDRGAKEDARPLEAVVNAQQNPASRRARRPAKPIFSKATHRTRSTSSATRCPRAGSLTFWNVLETLCRTP
jgi:hypothetical protein